MDSTKPEFYLSIGLTGIPRLDVPFLIYDRVGNVWRASPESKESIHVAPTPKYTVPPTPSTSPSPSPSPSPSKAKTDSSEAGDRKMSFQQLNKLWKEEIDKNKSTLDKDALTRPEHWKPAPSKKGLDMMFPKLRIHLVAMGPADPPRKADKPMNAKQRSEPAKGASNKLFDTEFFADDGRSQLLSQLTTEGMSLEHFTTPSKSPK